jgi:hypothetical protein
MGADASDYDPAMRLRRSIAEAWRGASGLPTWLLLGGIVVGSFLFRLHWAIRDPAPWIFSDELQYWEPGKAFAETGRFAIREVPGTGGFGALYPVLLAPAFLLFDRLPDAYDAVKTINSLLMSLTAVPVFFLARRLAGRGLALAAAALTVAVPSLTYTGNVMTENAFYPLVALWMLTLFVTLERPTKLRQLLVVLLTLAGVLTKAQAVTLVPAMVTAIALVVLLDALEPGRSGFLRRLGTGVLRFWPTWGLFALAIPLAIVRQAVRDQPLRELLGAYAAVLDRQYPVHKLATWALYHVAALDILLGFFPFAAFVLMAIWGLRPAAPRRFRIFAGLGVATVVWFIVVVAAFATTPTVERVLERNLFHVEPLFFIALVAWLAQGAPRPWWALAPAVLLSGTLTLALPLNDLINPTLIHSTPGLLPIWRWRDRFFSPASIDEVVALAAITAAVLMIVLSRRLLVPVTIGVLALYFAAGSRPVEGFTHQASTDAFLTIRAPRDWIDRAVGMDADVSSLYWAGDQFQFWEAEFFNDSVRALYSLPGPYDGLPGLADISVDPSGLVRGPDGRPVRAQYLLTDVDTKVAGRLVPADRAFGLVLYEVDGPVVVTQRVDGLYADRWSGSQVVYQRFACSGGVVTAHLSGDAKVNPDPIEVTATTGTGREYKATVAPGAPANLRVPLSPQKRVCSVTYALPAISPFLVRGRGDSRTLGAKFRFSYQPPA